MYNLNGKVALVTGVGGEHGIGRVVANRLAEEGADIIVNDLVSNPMRSTARRVGRAHLRSSVKSRGWVGKQCTLTCLGLLCYQRKSSRHAMLNS